MINPIPKKRKGVLLFVVLSALLVLFSMTASAMANTSVVEEKGTPSNLMQLLSQAKADYKPAPAPLIPTTSFGYYHSGTDVNFSSHTSLYTYTYATSCQVNVSAVFENDDLTPNLECYFGIFDYEKGDYGEYVKIYYVGDLTSTSMTYNGKIDTSGLSVSKDRYSIDAIIFDPTIGGDGDIDVYDEIGLNIKSIATPSISVASSGVHSVKVSWNAQGGVTGYRVYKATSATGTYSYVGSTAMNTYDCTGLTTGKTYYFKVRAYCSGGATAMYGSLSSYKYTKPTPPTPSVTAASASYTSIKLSWKAVPGATAYQIYRASSATGSYSYLKTTTGTSYTNTGLSTGKTYYYKVRVYHTESNGTKYYSNYCSYKSAKPIPSAPVVSASLGASNNSVTLKWTAVPGATKYEIYKNGEDPLTTYTYVTSVSSTTTSWTDTGLAPGEGYYYKVRAYHLEGTTKVYSPYSSSVWHGTVGTPVFNGTPELGGTCITLSWTGLEMTCSYELYRMNSEGGFDLISTVSAPPYSFLDSGLTPSTAYSYKMRCYHVEGSTKVYGAFSEVKTLTTKESIVLQAPVLNLYGIVYQGVSLGGAPGVAINWGSVTGANGYVIEFKDLNSIQDFAVIATTNQYGTYYYDWDSIDEEYGKYSYRVTPFYKNDTTGVYVEGPVSNVVTFYGSLVVPD